MTGATYTLDGVLVFELPTEGPIIQTEREAADILGDAIGQSAALVVLPASRLTPAFFQLRSGLAGAIVQKFVTYRVKLAIVGAIPDDAVHSTAFQAFIKESNRGQSIWFLDHIDDLKSKLSSSPN